MLSKSKFQIYTINPITNELLPTSEQVIFLDGYDNRNIIFSCIYNEKGMPSKEIIERMNTDPSVISYVVYYLAE